MNRDEQKKLQIRKELAELKHKVLTYTEKIKRLEAKLIDK